MPTIRDHWHASASTTPADLAPFTEADLDEARSRLTRLAQLYEVRIRALVGRGQAAQLHPVGGLAAGGGPGGRPGYAAAHPAASGAHPGLAGVPVAAPARLVHRVELRRIPDVGLETAARLADLLAGG